MHGLLRVRGFTQDDAHIFCTPEQIEQEIVSCLEFAVDTLKTFGFDRYRAEVSTWDGGVSGKYLGTPAEWDLAENALKRAVDRVGLEAIVVPEEAAFYGPKIDVKLVDCLDGRGSSPQCSSTSTCPGASSWSTSERTARSISL